MRTAMRRSAFPSFTIEEISDDVPEIAEKS
jgi:hypothetical protein